MRIPTLAILVAVTAVAAQAQGAAQQEVEQRQEESLDLSGFRPAVLGSQGPPAEAPTAAPPAEPAPRAPAPSPKEVAHFDQIRGYVGASVGLGALSEIRLFTPGRSWAAVLVGLHAGVWVGHFNLDLELAPFTDFAVEDRLQASFLALASIAGLAPIKRGEGGESSVGWPFRFWAGVSAPGFQPPVYRLEAGEWQPVRTTPLMVQMSLLGVAIRSNRLHVEVNLMSPYLVLGSSGLLGLSFLKVTVDVLL